MYLEGFAFLLALWLIVEAISAWQSLLYEKEKFEYLASKQAKSNEEIPMATYKPLKEFIIENELKSELEKTAHELEENEFELVNFEPENGIIEFDNLKYKRYVNPENITDR
jgi:hypothetical protein